MIRNYLEIAERAEPDLKLEKQTGILIISSK